VRPEAIEALASGSDSPEAKQLEKWLEAYGEDLGAALMIGGYALTGGAAGEEEGRLDVSLVLPEPPVETNGRWDEGEQRIEWIGLPLWGYPFLSSMLYAVWAEPDRAFQEAHFGRVVAEREALRDYGAWHAELSDEQRRIWDEFVTSLRPGEQLIARLEEFRFPDDPAELDKQGKLPPSAAAPAIRLLVAALREPAPGAPEPTP
jgi:hypothetical protein